MKEIISLFLLPNEHLQKNCERKKYEAQIGLMSSLKVFIFLFMLVAESCFAFYGNIKVNTDKATFTVPLLYRHVYFLLNRKEIIFY